MRHCSITSLNQRREVKPVIGFETRQPVVTRPEGPMSTNRFPLAADIDTFGIP